MTLSPDKSLPHKTSITLAHKVYFIVLVSVACCALFIGTFSYFQDRRMLSENIGSGLQKIAQTAALSIDGAELGAITSREDVPYKKIRRYLTDIKRYNKIISPIYILRKTGPDKASLLVTTEEGSPLGAEFKLNPVLKRVLQSGKSDFSHIYTDGSGTWISAYAPVENERGYILGALVLDLHVGYYMQQLTYRLLKIMMFPAPGYLSGIHWASC